MNRTNFNNHIAERKVTDLYLGIENKFVELESILSGLPDAVLLDRGGEVQRMQSILAFLVKEVLSSMERK